MFLVVLAGQQLITSKIKVSEYMQIFLKCTCTCVYLYIQTHYTQYTHTHYVNTNFYFGCD